MSDDLEYAVRRLEEACAANEGNARNIYGEPCDGIATATPAHIRALIADWRKRGDAAEAMRAKCGAIARSLDDGTGNSADHRVREIALAIAALKGKGDPAEAMRAKTLKVREYESLHNDPQKLWSSTITASGKIVDYEDGFYSEDDALAYGRSAINGKGDGK